MYFSQNHGKFKISWKNYVVMVNKMPTATVTSKGMITLPKEVREKLGLKKGMKVEFIEREDGFLIVPIKPLEESFGDGGKEMLEIARELHEERRAERIHDESEI